MFVDTPCHLFPEYYENLNALEKTILDAGIVKVINNGTDDQSNKIVLDLINKYNYMYGAIGIHPEAVDSYKEEDLLFALYSYSRLIVY